MAITAVKNPGIILLDTTVEQYFENCLASGETRCVCTPPRLHNAPVRAKVRDLITVMINDGICFHKEDAEMQRMLLYVYAKQLQLHSPLVHCGDFVKQILARGPTTQRLAALM